MAGARSAFHYGAADRDVASAAAWGEMLMHRCAREPITKKKEKKNPQYKRQTKAARGRG